MNSSISDSDPRWRRLLVFYAASLLLLALILGAILLALDPYDSGRFALFDGNDVPRFGQRLTAASLGRRAGFDTAIVGNSTVQLLDPARIGAASGRAVVSLTVPGTGPREQLVVADWFLRHHPGAATRGLVFGIDGRWCRGDGRLELTNPFPFWLYSRSAVDYARHMMRLKSVEAAARKVKLLLGREAGASWDGYSDYEAGRVWDPAAVRQRLAKQTTEAKPMDETATGTEFAAMALLQGFLARLPRSAAVVLVLPPRYHAAVPPPGSAAAARQEACRQALEALVAARPGTRLLDFLSHPVTSDDATEFWDLLHYRARVARRIEAAVAAALRQ